MRLPALNLMSEDERELSRMLLLGIWGYSVINDCELLGGIGTCVIQIHFQNVQPLADLVSSEKRAFG
jgi:hypothetical protein